MYLECVTTIGIRTILNALENGILKNIYEAFFTLILKFVNYNINSLLSRILFIGGFLKNFFIGILIGGHDFTNLILKVGDAQIRYGSLIQNIVDFLIIAFCIFIFISIINKFFNKKEEVKEVTKKSDEVVLLEEIRDLLKKE